MLNPLVRAPRATDLAAPVGTLMRPTLTVETGDSLARGAQMLRENGGGALPVVDAEGRFRGVLSDVGLARALAEASEPTDAVEGYLNPAETVAPYATAAEALRRGEHGQILVVVDDARRVVGLISAVDLWPRRRKPPRPAMVGGMATPFGVYLTTGNVSAGAPWWALMATGAAMFAMFFVGDLASNWSISKGVPVQVGIALSFAIFLLLMRLSPLAGTHGAEHQVVHAIEREESLTPEVVSRMPRVHPRCGTNLMAGLGIFFAIRSIPGIGDLGYVLSMLVALVLAMPVGAFAQRWITTKHPTPKQLQNAIRAGEELLVANVTARRSQPSPLQRIVNMGVLQVMAGAALTLAAIGLLKAVTRWPWLPDAW